MFTLLHKVTVDHKYLSSIDNSLKPRSTQSVNGESRSSDGYSTLQSNMTCKVGCICRRLKVNMIIKVCVSYSNIIYTQFTHLSGLISYLMSPPAFPIQYVSSYIWRFAKLLLCLTYFLLSFIH